MPKMILRCETGYYGTESVEGYIVTEAQYSEYINCVEPCDMDTFGQDEALNNALAYGILPEPTHSSPDPDFEYSDDISWHWEDYDPVIHGAEYKFTWEFV